MQSNNKNLKILSFHILNFEMLYCNKTFIVEYETESRVRNRMMDVRYEGFPLDIPLLRQSHPLLYGQLKAAMVNNSDTYWTDKQESLPPVVKAMNNILHAAFPTLVSLLLIFASFSTKAQGSDLDKQTFALAQFNAGYSIQAKAPTFGVGFGVRTGNVYLSFDDLIAISRNALIPKIFKINAGYNIGSFQPFISCGYQTIGAEAEAYFKDTPDQFLNGFRLGYGVSYYFKQFPLCITLQQQGKQTNLSTGFYKTF